jgi:hypothetical protein
MIKLPFTVSAVRDELWLDDTQWEAIQSLPEENENGDNERREVLVGLAATQIASQFSFGEPVAG